MTDNNIDIKLESDLLEFYGTECSHCKIIEPLIAKLEKEEGVKVIRLEVWHNEKNAQLLRKLDKSLCGGIPFLYNMKTGKWICISASYEELKKWALGLD